jgi:hypothetical protein
MKTIATIMFYLVTTVCIGQELQLHYDFRHSIDPALNARNFPWINFKYFKKLDTLGKGDFLLEVQSYLDGKKHNIGQTFFQMAQNIKFWKPKLYLYLYYSGGLGVTRSSFGYYISNSYSIGVTYPITFPKTWLSISLMYRYSALSKPSHDPQLNFYIGGALMNYRLIYSNTLVFWAPDRNNGLPENLGKKGKHISFFGDPQIWYTLGKGFSAGTRVSLYYRVLTSDNRLRAYPTVGIKKAF